MIDLQNGRLQPEHGQHCWICTNWTICCEFLDGCKCLRNFWMFFLLFLFVCCPKMLRCNFVLCTPCYPYTVHSTQWTLTKVRNMQINLSNKLAKRKSKPFCQWFMFVTLGVYELTSVFGIGFKLCALCSICTVSVFSTEKKKNVQPFSYYYVHIL